MVKADINAVFRKGLRDTNSSKIASKSTSAFLGTADLSMLENLTAIPVRSIPIDKVQPRAVNEFSDVKNIELEESIRLYGMIDPISVSHKEEEDIYTIISGHRRYNAILNLRNKFPKEKRYAMIDCRIYEVTEDTFLLAQGLPYITKDQEEAIYRDSNLQSRQLTDQDIAKQIRKIVLRFSDMDYIDFLRESAKKNGINTYDHTDRVKLISSVVASQNWKGWSREKIRQYLIVYNTGNEVLLQKIENGEMAVKTAYKTVLSEQNKNRDRKTKKLPQLQKITLDFVKEYQKGLNDYTEEDLIVIQNCIDQLTEILKKEKQ